MIDPVTVTIGEIKILTYMQPRVLMRSEIVEEYSEAMKAGEVFPPITVFFDGTEKFLVDGFHRIQALKNIGERTVQAIIIKGTQRDAMLWSCSANARHGLQRTREDKRRAVENLLKDEEWGKWSDSTIAKRCIVSEEMVKRIREDVQSHLPKSESDERKVITKHGTETTMKTGNIGKRTTQENGVAVKKDDPPRPAPAPAVTPEEQRANEHAAKMAEKFPPVERVQPVSTTQTSGPVNLTVKTPPNVSRIPPVFKDQYDVVIKRGLQVGVSERMAEGYATDLDDAVLKALDFWVNNIRDYTEATAL